MSDIHSGSGAVPSVPTEGLEQSNTIEHSAIPANTLPPALPGQRTALRLLDVVDQLARHVQMLERRSNALNGAVPVVAAPSENNGVQLQNLQRENATLKQRQTEAKKRLQALLVRIEAARQNEHIEPVAEALQEMNGGQR